MENLIKIYKNFNYKITKIDIIKSIKLKSDITLISQKVYINRKFGDYIIEIKFDKNFYDSHGYNYLKSNNDSILFYTSKIFDTIKLNINNINDSYNYNGKIMKFNNLIVNQNDIIKLNNKSVSIINDDTTIIYNKIIYGSNKLINSLSYNGNIITHESEHKNNLGIHRNDILNSDNLYNQSKEEIMPSFYNNLVDNINSYIDNATKRIPGVISNEIIGEIEIISNLFC